jgi:hypothetical protein
MVSRAEQNVRAELCVLDLACPFQIIPCNLDRLFHEDSEVNQLARVVSHAYSNGTNWIRSALLPSKA